MSILEQKVDAICRFLAASTQTAREKEREKITELLKQKSDGQFAKLARKDAIEYLLLEIGIPESILGYQRLVCAIGLVIDKPDLVHRVNSGLYPIVAAECNTTGRSVERTIRHAIEVAFDRGNFEMLEQLFGGTIDPNKGKATNTAFIARISNEIKKKGY